jgi:hypothetical protein
MSMEKITVEIEFLNSYKLIMRKPSDPSEFIFFTEDKVLHCHSVSGSDTEDGIDLCDIPEILTSWRDS